ncbi:MAG: dihydrofolate reductase [Bacillota bacterium]|nr:dihydrofolate reductase [Bacillota bacterium]
MTISIIVAMDKNSLIGKGNELPWNIPEDLAYFKEITTGHKVIMGRKTFESIGKPLPNRTNIVITRDTDFKPAGCQVVNSVEEVMDLIKKDEEAFIIGGAQVYKRFLPLTNKLYITKIAGEYTGETYFPPFNCDEWECISEKAGDSCTFIVLSKK